MSQLDFRLGDPWMGLDFMPPLGEKGLAKNKSKISVLLVDDEPIQIELGVEILSGMGFDIVSADSLDAAISILIKIKIDVVISDVHMPNGSGLDLLREINKMNRPKPSVFLVSGLARISSEELQELGAIELLQKPIDYDLLRKKIVHEFRQKEPDSKGKTLGSSFDS